MRLRCGTPLPALGLAALAVLAACSTTAPTAGSPPAPPAAPAPTDPPATTTTADPLPGVEGTIYAIERGGDLVELDLATDSRRRWPLPDRVRDAAAREIAVLAEGLIVYEHNGTAAAAIPFDDPANPVVLRGERIVGRALDRAVSAPAGAPFGRLLDGRGQLTVEVPPNDRWGVDRSLVVRGDLMLRRGSYSGQLAWTLTSTGERRPAGFDRLGPRNRSFFLAEQVLTDDSGLPGPCVVVRGSWDRWVEPLDTVADPGFCSFHDQAALSPDGRYAAQTVGRVDDPNQTIVYDLDTGARTTPYRIDGSLQPTGFTADSGHLVMADGLERGTVTVVAIDGSRPPATVDFGGPLRAVALGPPTTGGR